MRAEAAQQARDEPGPVGAADGVDGVERGLRGLCHRQPTPDRQHEADDQRERIPGQRADRILADDG